ISIAPISVAGEPRSAPGHSLPRRKKTPTPGDATFVNPGAYVRSGGRPFARFMQEPGTDGAVLIIDVHGGGAKSADDLTLGGVLTGREFIQKRAANRGPI